MTNEQKRSRFRDHSDMDGFFNAGSSHPRQIVMASESRRRQRIAYAVIFSVIAIAFAFGAASTAHSEQEKVATREAIAMSNQQAAAATSPSEITPEKASAPEDSAEPPAENSTASESRDASFAVNPERREWNYEDNGRKTVYLTIDDGPSENTQAVLDILDQYGCKATFFVIGHNDAYFPMIAEAYRRGHTIGLHSMTHDYASVYSSIEAYFDDLAAIGQVVKDQIGYVPCFIRFPGGSSNAISADYTEGIMSALTGLVQEQGYQYYDWSVSTGDGAEHTADELVAYACEPTEENNIIILCHDSSTKQTTVEALPRIIEHYQELGYTFEALDRSSWVCHHGVNN